MARLLTNSTKQSYETTHLQRYVGGKIFGKIR
jgi:hypothetical protein